MKVFVVLALVGAALAAPPVLTRSKRGPYGSEGYGAPLAAPCGGAAPLALYLSPGPQLASAAVVPALVPSLYREGEQQPQHGDEHLEHQHSVSARSYYGPGAINIAAAAASSGAIAAAPSAISLSAPAAVGPAVGVFPSAKIGGCAVPLLLSCAPNVVSGHLAHSAPAYSAPAPAYRDQEGPADAHKMRETPDKVWAPNAHAHAKAAVETHDELAHHQFKMDN